MYYRIRNKERLLHPCEQEQIAAINTTGKSLFQYVLTKGYSHRDENTLRKTLSFFEGSN